MAISNNSTGLRPGVCTSTTRPTNPYEGFHIYETDTDIEYVWNGSAWVVNYVSAASPAFTGTPTAPTATAGTNTTQLATTAFANQAGGLVLLSKTVITVGGTFSSAFNSTYDHYKIIADVTCDSNGNGIYFRGQGSAENTHQGNIVYVNVGNTTVYNERMATYTTYAYTCGYTSARVNLEIDIYNPYSATIPSRMKSTFVGSTWNGSTYGTDSAAASSTAFYLTPNGGNFTGGTITVYGYKKG